MPTRNKPAPGRKTLAVAPPRTRKLTIIAQDPAVRMKGRILRARVDVPAEELAPGPWGYRVHVIDYDASTQTLYKPSAYPAASNGRLTDPYDASSDAQLLNDPGFHAQNAYAIVMRTLARFEHALGRRVSWSFYGHQLKIAPHAFADANAFYSKDDQALMFGYFPGSRGTVFSCLSHDVVAHETTHALVDGLRERYTDPSSPDQAAFHEGLADVVALLSVFSLPDVVAAALDLHSANGAQADKATIARNSLSPEALRNSVLLGMAEQMGEEMSAIRGKPLRRSATLKPSRDYLSRDEYMEPHRRGEILVASMLNAFIAVWSDRLQALGEVKPGRLDRGRVVEEGARAADYLLTMAIRALDYCPPVHLEFCDYLSALLTADAEIRPDDSTYRYRFHLRQSFDNYGIRPASKGTPQEPGIWLPPEQDAQDGALRYDRTHFEPMTRDPDEVFRFIWENRRQLELCDGAYSRVLSVRPCLRSGPDGFALRETVAEFIQILTLRAAELKTFKIKIPKGMDPDMTIPLHGGGVLIFDEYGRLKFHVHNRVDNAKRQNPRLKYLWDYGQLAKGASLNRRFSHLHRLRARNARTHLIEEWN